MARPWGARPAASGDQAPTAAARRNPLTNGARASSVRAPARRRLFSPRPPAPSAGSHLHTRAGLAARSTCAGFPSRAELATIIDQLHQRIPARLSELLHRERHVPRAVSGVGTTTAT